jgi:hypothetical protein
MFGLATDDRTRNMFQYWFEQTKEWQECDYIPDGANRKLVRAITQENPQFWKVWYYSVQRNLRVSERN